MNEFHSFTQFLIEIYYLQIHFPQAYLSHHLINISLLYFHCILSLVVFVLLKHKNYIFSCNSKLVSKKLIFQFPFLFFCIDLSFEIQDVILEDYYNVTIEKLKSTHDNNPFFHDIDINGKTIYVKQYDNNESIAWMMRGFLAWEP